MVAEARLVLSSLTMALGAIGVAPASSVNVAVVLMPALPGPVPLRSTTGATLAVKVAVRELVPPGSGPTEQDVAEPVQVPKVTVHANVDVPGVTLIEATAAFSVRFSGHVPTIVTAGVPSPVAPAHAPVPVVG